MVLLPDVLGIKTGAGGQETGARAAGETREGERRGGSSEEQAGPLKVCGQGLGGSTNTPRRSSRFSDVDPWQASQAKLQLNEMVKQEMKSVIRAQHARIEEYRREVQAFKRHMSLKDRSAVQQEVQKEESRLRKEASIERPGRSSSDEEESGSYSNVQLHLLEDMRKEVAKSRADQGELEAEVRRLKTTVGELKSKNMNLKRAARRYTDMLSQLGAPNAQLSALSSTIPTTPASLTRSPTACESVLDESAARASMVELGSVTPRTSKDSGQGDSQEIASSPSRKGPRWRSPSSALVVRHQSDGGQTAAGGRRWAARASRDAMALWHEENPRRLLHELLYTTSQIVDFPSLALFVVDPWVRRCMEEREEEGGCGDGRQLTCTTFYLSGKVTAHGYRRDGLRAEPPRFPDLACLPIVGRGTVLALPLQAAPGRPILAALQATAASAAPQAQEGEGVGSCNALALSDSQLAGLQLLCTTAAGILDMKRQVECAKALHTRTLGYFNIMMKVQSMLHISELEQRAKPLLTSFFSVVTARITFYSPSARELLLLTATTRSSKSQEEEETEQPKASIGRRNITRISVQDGVVGRCVRKRQIFHLDPVMQSPLVSEVADGVEVDGEKGQINMLVGPMTAEPSDDQSIVVGVIQLIQKRLRKDKDPCLLEHPLTTGSSDSKDKADGGAARRSSCCEPFTEEDQSLFSDMLRVLGMATYRTMMVQASVDMEEVRGQRAHPCIEKLLGVA